MLRRVLRGFAAAWVLLGALAGGYLALAAKPPAVSSEQQTQAMTGPASGQVELHDIKYDQLVKKVRQLRGNIVVVDVWATYCVPCKRELPHLVELHKKHAREGAVCLSISVDDQEQSANALKFLRSKQATFWNYRLDEEPKVWQKRWNVEQIPLVMVLDRTGQLVAKFPREKDEAFTYAEVEKVVRELLSQPH